MVKQTSSADRLFGRSVIYGKADEYRTPYMTRYWFGRLRLHIFHRGDQDEDCHDHPWDFWTFPFHSYVEEVVESTGWGEYEANGHKYTYPLDSVEARYSPLARDRGRPMLIRHQQIVPRFRWTFRPATHTHRVLGRYYGPTPNESLNLYDEGRLLEPGGLYGEGRIVTIVWRSAPKRAWGFLKNRDGQWCWTPWKEYVFGGGKNAPCE